MVLSFIIPAYNASGTIIRCLDSIYQLPMEETDFEVIVVDDCSEDNTFEIIKWYANSHDNLILLQQKENHRQGAARNQGIAIAKGEFIAFVDSDDATAKGMLFALEIAQKCDLDMVVMNYEHITVDGKINEKMSLQFVENEIFTGVELQTKHPFWGTSTWPYLYRSSFLKYVNYPFVEDVLYEDADFVNVHLYHAKRMAYSRECGYKFFENKSSTTHTLSYINVADYFLLGTRMLKFYSSLENKTSEYASTILEGGSFNIWIAFIRLNKLPLCKDIVAVYDRIDNRYDRRILLSYREPRYCWTKWTNLCLKHKNIALSIASIAKFGKILLKRI